ncbi:MAG: GNAT family N-acetyltransferase [Clostridiaceae bacterium]
MKEIYTKRLILRNFTPEDAKDLQEIIISKETSKYAIYDNEFPTSLEEVKKVNHRFSLGDKFLAVWEPIDQKVIGFICLNGDSEDMLDLGFCFNALYHGKGYATEASSAVIDYAFNTLLVEHLESGTANLNDPARRLLEKLRFTKQNEETLSFRKTPDGKPIEFIGSNYLLEKDEWFKRK